MADTVNLSELAALFPGVEPGQLQSLIAQFQPNDEDKKRRLHEGLATFGLSLLANPYKGHEVAALGQAGLFGMQAGRAAMQDSMKERGQALTQAMGAQKLMKDAQMQEVINSVLTRTMGRSGAPAGVGMPSDVAQGGGAPTGGGGPVGGGAPQVGGIPYDPATEFALALSGKKEGADVLHRQNQITQGPNGDLLRNGQLIGRSVPGGTVYFDGTPGGRFEPINAEALAATARQAGAVKGAEVGATEAAQNPYRTITTPTGPNGAPRTDYVPNTLGAPPVGGAASAAPQAGAPGQVGERVTLNLKDAPRKEALALLRHLTGGGGGAPVAAGGGAVGPDPLKVKAAEADIETNAQARRDANKGGIGQVDKSYEAASNAATNGISTIHDARAALDSGRVISGAGADFRLNFARGASLAGSEDAAGAVAATQTFAATQARQVISIIKSLGSGSGISDADREYAAGIVGGRIALDEASMRKLLDISERAQRAQIAAHNARTDKAAKALQNPDLREFYTVPEPPQYVPPKAAAQAAGMPTLTPAGNGNATVRHLYQQALKAGDQAAIDALKRKGYVQ